MADKTERGSKTTYENTRTGQKEKLDPADPAVQARVASGELREAAE